MRALSLVLPLLLLLTTACNSQTKVANGEADTTTTTTVESQALSYRYAPPATPGVVEPIDTTEAYWREILSPQAYEVLREDGTERSFTSPLNDEKRPGVFACAACGLPLFASSTKFNSGTGWPSFYEPIDPAYIKEDEDFRYGMRRVEVSCARCDGHQGHVFPDGPDPTGLRYCINGVSLNFVPQADLK
ncbi:peptide-methionine (R)-S-oxide reductase MsrB [Neolewinella lacunae]|uniref:Peptide methionine sulfoxide reductase MsrB n=1 Tax=Neolewinella lacunae TaxID=1517758 RepID=A0A923PLV0_9BACT|nr:peptide-methionine (R)-S-oxide reductase MsrB [Neolewinella lacunae]MBC6993573.1 peptide-methionine (R)-S-oxide reductase MsrB [Neolewinella lacunae]MDN3636152.1 peptide-methionine (R)-S-oxide reductase MsrB [Neolewinella lacunae]